MTRGRPTILLTGFGPFPRVPVNVSSLLIEAAADVLRDTMGGWAIESRALPTEWENGPRQMALALSDCSPALAIHVGVSRRARGFEIETRAHNICVHAPDAAGHLPNHDWIERYAPRERPCTLPSALIAARLREHHLPAWVSRDAGAYLCNAILYRSLELTATGQSQHRALFVHVPATLTPPGLQSQSSGRTCPLTWSDAVTGLVEIVRTSAQLPRIAAADAITA